MNNNAEEILNKFISGKIDTNLISDGYHTFGELYHHRTILYIALCKSLEDRKEKHIVWKSKFHSDGTSFNGWFVLGIFRDSGKQITYHVSNDYWDDCSFAETIEKAPEFDGHSSKDVLERIIKLF